MDNGKNWHRIDIISSLHKRGITMAGLARQAGLKPSTLRNALDRKWPKGEQLIAHALDLNPADIWPERYPQVVQSSSFEIAMR